MGNIPAFTRIVTPDRSLGGAAIDAARAKGDMAAQRYQQAGMDIARANNTFTDYELQEARADNATWVNAQSIEYRKNLYDGIDQMRHDRQSSPLNFHKDFDKHATEIAQGYLDTAPSEAARAALQQQMGDLRTNFYDDNLKWTQERNLSIFGERMDNSADNLKIMAYRRGQQGGALEDSGIPQDIEATVVTGASFVAPEKLGNIRNTIQRDVVANYFEGMAEKNPAAAKELLASKKYDDALGAEGIQKAEIQIKKAEEQAQAEARVKVGGNVDDVQEAMKLGLAVPSEQVRSLAAQADAAGMKREAQSMRDYLVLQPKVEAFGKMPMVQQTAMVADTRRAIEQGGVFGRSDELAAYQTILKTKAAALESDPYSYYASAKVVPEPGALDYGDPSALAGELNARRASAQIVKDFDGIALPLFTKGEVSQMKTLLSSGDTAAASSIMMNRLGAALKPVEMQALGRQMAQESKTLAAVLANGDPLVGERILAGAALKGEVNTGEFREKVNTMLSGAVSAPEAFETAHDAIWSYYKQLSFAAGDSGKEIDDDRMQQAITDVVGPVVEIDRPGWFNGDASHVLSYRDTTTSAWVDGDQLNTTFEKLDDVALKTMGAGPAIGPNGLEWSAATLKEQARIVSAGDGIYAFIDDKGRYVTDAKGAPLRVDARALEGMRP